MPPKRKLPKPEPLNPAARDWLAQFIVRMARVANKPGHPCRTMARHAIKDWALWRWTVDGMSDGVVKIGARKGTGPGLRHHHDPSRKDLTEELLVRVQRGESAQQVREYLDKYCKARTVTDKRHREIHGRKAGRSRPRSARGPSRARARLRS